MIELVTVIVVLGVLVAFAVPRFADLESEAREAVLLAHLGTMRSASSLSHSLSLTQQLGGAAPVQMEGAAVSMANAYPDAPGMLTAANIDVAQFQVQQFGNNAFTLWVTGTTGWGACGIAYVRSIPPGIPIPLFLGPNTSGC